MDKLKPCPNEKHETNRVYALRGRYNWWFVKCLVCGMSTNLYETKENATNAWKNNLFLKENSNETSND